MRKPAYLAATALATLSLAGTAHAAEVSFMLSQTATCSKDGTVKATIGFSGFTGAQKPIDGTVSLNMGRGPNTTVRGFTFPGADGTLTVTFPKAITDNDLHFVSADFSWPQQGSENHKYYSYVQYCFQLPVVPPSPLSSLSAKTAVRASVSHPARWRFKTISTGPAVTVVEGRKKRWGTIRYFTAAQAADGSVRVDRSRTLDVP